MAAAGLARSATGITFTASRQRRQRRAFTNDYLYNEIAKSPIC